jgi:hypothetical protein
MSEEESNFKVTDRRLFNSDGTPRDYEREESSDPTPAPAKEDPAAAESQASASTQSETLPSDEGASASESQDETRPAEEEPVDLNDHAAIPGADDPASFINFLMSIASNAASALGMMEHPVTGERGVDLELGKHWIDILGMLKEKTQGNLHPQEEKIFTGLLADLRMQFVSLSKAPPKPPGAGGLTGRDIIGG